jgi:phytoene dehydrogenase-like protein
MQSYDAIVVGAGPNGLAAAIVLARAGRSVLVREGADTIGGGARSAELTLPGFVHDVCSAVHPLAVASPLFRQLPLDRYGLAWIEPPSPLAHPLDDEPAVVMERSIEATSARLGKDAHAYRRLFGRLAADWEYIAEPLLGPLRIPRHPAAHGALRPGRRALGGGIRARSFSRAARTRVVRRPRRALAACAHASRVGGIRARIVRDRARSGMADTAWRRASAKRRTRRVLALARRGHRRRRSGFLAA